MIYKISGISMDASLKCNVLLCRKMLNGQVYITSCSRKNDVNKRTRKYAIRCENMIDIFCKDCSVQFFQKALVCPACKTVLSDKCDLFMTDLQPSDEWKSVCMHMDRARMFIYSK